MENRPGRQERPEPGVAQLEEAGNGPGHQGRDLGPVTEACGFTSTPGSLASHFIHILPPPPPVLLQEIKNLEKRTVQIY